MKLLHCLIVCTCLMIAVSARSQDTYRFSGFGSGTYATAEELYRGIVDGMRERAQEIMDSPSLIGSALTMGIAFNNSVATFWVSLLQENDDAPVLLGFEQTEGNENPEGELDYGSIEDGVTAILAAIEVFLDQMSPVEMNQMAVAETATNPVAGNPSSLQSTMIASDFQIGSMIGNQPTFGSAGAGGAGSPNLIGVGAKSGRLTGKNTEIEFLELPFSYAFSLNDPRYAVIVDAPIRMTTYNGHNTYSASVGAGVRLPVTDNWTITPVGRIGLSFSDNSDTNGMLYSASVVSNFHANFRGIDMDLGNQLSHIRSVPGGSDNYELQNTVVKNGVGFRGKTALTVFDLPVTWAASVANTQFMGDALFINSMTDISVSLGTTSSDNGVQWDSMRLGVTYSFGDEDLEGFEVNFGYRF